MYKYLLEIFYENVVEINLGQDSVSGELLYIELRKFAMHRGAEFLN